MPRRSRPSHRLPPNKGNKSEQLEDVLSKPKQKITRFVEQEAVDSEDEARFDDEEGSEGELGVSDDDEFDADAPRVSVWEEDNEDFVAQQDVEENNENRLQNDLLDLPLGALRRAQQLLNQAVAESDSETEGKVKERVEWSTKPLIGGGRRNKHAPVETTAKKPVTRKRMVVDVPKIMSRDPRFLPTAGVFDPRKFQQSYGFLAESRKTELQMLRESLTKARKMLTSAPKELRSEREEEVERLERAMKRAESMVNRDRTVRVDQEALSKIKKEGKGRWFLKKADEKDMLMKARDEMLAKEGGQRAVTKAIEKRQKKQSQKEKRSRPYVEGERPRKRARP